MDINEVLKKIDQLFEENKAKDAEKLMLDTLTAAAESGDDAVRLHMLNELIGYYRQTSEIENLLRTVDEAVKCAEQMGLKDSIPYATTVLNAANGYRAAGKMEESLKYYNITENIYRKLLPEDDMQMAGLYNNQSLLYQELGDYESAEKYLRMALNISVKNNAGFEIAVTYANLANTLVISNKFDEAEINAQKAIECFKKINLYDAHYCAALSALGLCFFRKKEYDEAEKLFSQGMDIIENSLGRNLQYERLKVNRDACLEAQKSTENKGKKTNLKGLELCRKYYEEYGAKMIEDKFPEYAGRIAVGLVGEGSDCMGYDDDISEDHDWGPDFCIWVTDETYEKIGKRLEEEYNKLPTEFMGYHRTKSAQGYGRRGVMTVSGFYKRILNCERYEDIDWRMAEDYALATAVNGEVFRDDEGIFSEFRNKLLQGYPESIRFLKLAEDVAKVSQNGQYNYFRMIKRNDKLTADILLAECIKNAMKLQHHICNVYPPHDKWLHRSLMGLPGGRELDGILSELHRCMNGYAANGAAVVNVEAGTTGESRVKGLTEQLGSFFAGEMYENCDISDIDSYLDMHTEELLEKSLYSKMSDTELVEQIAGTEFEAFDKVKNEGGRASCQNDWPTFSVMRKSQYMTWNRTMLLQYLYDFNREYRKGHNLITEKYGRMMESTAPDRYEEIKDNFPELSDEKKAVIEQIVGIQMEMMESFAEKHPNVAQNARSLHTYEDNIVNTSYETYLRGEISTYSDKMLQLYGMFVVQCASNNVNIAFKTIENSAKLYGYKNIEEFEKNI